MRAFLLTQRSEQGRDGIDFHYWLSGEQGPVQLTVTAQEAVCFFPASQRAELERRLAELPGWRIGLPALQTPDRQPVAALYCRSLDTLYRARERLRNRITLLEDDIRPAERYLMERFIGAGLRLAMDASAGSTAAPLRDIPITRDDYRPNLRLLSLDIETAIDHPELYSIGLAGEGYERVLMKGQGVDTALVRYVADERALLRALEAEVASFDPDLIIGWNLIQFDIQYLYHTAERLGMSLRLGRQGAPLKLRRAGSGQWHATLDGRVLVDGIEALRGATYHFESYSLEAVSQALLGRGKLIDEAAHRGWEITRLYRDDPQALAAYNLEDCRLVLDIFAQARLTDYLVERAALTGLTMDRIGGSAAAFDHLYLPRLHRQGYVAPAYASGARGLDSPGGYVMESRPGLYRHVLVLDFKSLYPSLIRSFLIDPAGLYNGLQLAASETVPGFNGARFCRDAPILPALLAELWQARDRAKADANTPLATAIKIIMNAFYGVLGSPQCRFFDQRLSSSITLRGHQVLTESGRFVADQGYTVIYGDTDSLFVWLEGGYGDAEADAVGNRLAAELNTWWRQRLQREYGLLSYLEIEYEAHYRRFLMPTLRGAERGSKKRYAGIVAGRQPQLVFKGLEAVRSDWTPLARQFQQELYRRIFADEPYADYVEQTVARLLAGELDELLVYRKRLRRPLEDYTRSQPPHVQAARKARQQQLGAGITRDDAERRIRYLITQNGPEPLGFSHAAIDYQHYLDKQLAPVADAILPFIGDSFARLVGQQGELF